MVHFSCGCSLSRYTFPVHAVLHGARVYFFQGCTFLLLQKLPRRQAWQGVNWPSEKKPEQKRTREIAWKCIFQLGVQSKLSKHENIELKEVSCLIAWGLFQAYKISNKEQQPTLEHQHDNAIFPPKYTFREESPTLSTELSSKVRHLTGASSELLSVLVLNLPHYPSVPTGHWPCGFLLSTKTQTQTQTGHQSIILNWYEVRCSSFGLGGSEA